MITVVHLEDDVRHRVEQTWRYAKEQYGLEALPPYLSSLIKLALCSAVNELTILYYTYGINETQYCDEGYADDQIETYVDTLMEHDLTGDLYREMLNVFNSLTCDDHGFAALYFSQADAETNDEEDFVDDLARCIMVVVYDALMSASFTDILPELSSWIPEEAVVADVEPRYEASRINVRH